MFRTFLLVLTFAASTSAAQPFRDNHPVNFQGRGPAHYPVHGIDAARFQDPINWQAARQAGVQFAFVKATEGGDLVDPLFADHWNGARQAGVPVGAYHFYYFCRPAEDQARWFIRNVPRAGGALPPVLDMEWNPYSPTCTYRPPADVVRREAQIFLNMITRHYGQRPILYTTPEFYRRNDMGRIQGVEFWLRSTANTPAQSYPGQHWTFWQYTGTGVVPGVRKEVDINAFVGGRREWQQWLRARRR